MIHSPVLFITYRSVISLSDKKLQLDTKLILLKTNLLIYKIAKT